MVMEDGAWRRLFSAQRTGPVRVALHPHLWGISTGENLYFCGLNSARFIRHFTRALFLVFRGFGSGCRRAPKLTSLPAAAHPIRTRSCQVHPDCGSPGF